MNKIEMQKWGSILVMLKFLWKKTFLKELFILFILFSFEINAQNFPYNLTFETGTAVVNLGVEPQTYDNGLKPYGMVYDLVSNGIPVYWAFSQEKNYGEEDFSIENTSYKGSVFIISKEFIDNSTITSTLLNNWESEGVVITYVTGNFEVSVYDKITSFPKIVLDEENDQVIKQVFIDKANLPEESYFYNASPEDLNASCDDVYVLPHADPHKWTLERIGVLKNFVQQGGYLWAGCHSVSALETYTNSLEENACESDLNFLSNGGLVPWKKENGCDIQKHNNQNSGDYSYNSDLGGSPFTQLIGTMDGAFSNGSERIYMPKQAGWRSSTKLFVTDDLHPQVVGGTNFPVLSPGPASLVVFGRAYGDENAGMVMYEASHKINQGTEEEDVAAARLLGNFILKSGLENQIEITMNSIVPEVVEEGAILNLDANINEIEENNYSFEWTSSCGGDFSSPFSANTTFEVPFGVESCLITLKVEDSCGRFNYWTEVIQITPTLSVDFSYEKKCEDQENEILDLSSQISGGIEPYSFNWEFLPDGVPILSTDENPEPIVFTSSGIKIVKLEVIDATGLVKNVQKEITIEECCHFDLACTSSTIDLSCEEDIPNPATNIEELILLGFETNSNFCQNIQISSEDIWTTVTDCQKQLIRKYTIIKDDNLDGIFDVNSESVIVCDQVYLINDTIAPEFSSDLPEDITVSCENIPEVPIVEALDSCSEVVIDFNETSNEVSECVYTLTRVWTATDVCGNSSEHIQTVTVEDTLAPEFSSDLPEDITVSCENIPEVPTLEVSDSCSEVVIDFSETTNEVSSCIFTVARVWTVTDVCGNSLEHTQIITVEDTLSPEFSSELPEDITVSCEDIPEVPTLEALDSCSEVVIDFSETTNEVSDCVYTITRVWTATNICGNSSEYIQTVTVEDTLAPEFSSELPEDIIVSCEDIPQVPILEASDSCSEVVIDFNETTNEVSDCVYTLTRVWTATDICGNSSEYSQIITVEDILAPDFSSDLPEDITISCENIPEIPTLEASDTCTEVVIDFNETTNEVSDCVYTLTRVWTATDTCGNSSEYSQIITVEDTLAPEFTSDLPEDITVSCEDILEVPTVEASDSCSEIVIDFSETSNEISDCVYTITRVWTATDVCGNSSEYTQNITVEDTLAPEFTSDLPEDITVSCEDIPEVPIIEASDSCSEVVISFEENTIPIEDCNYTITRTWIITDSCGNAAEHNQTITVEDQEAPLFLNIPEDITISCNETIPAVDEDFSAMDNCMGDITANMEFVEDAMVPNTSECDVEGTILQHWLIEDSCGNQTTHTRTITIIDEIPPSLALCNIENTVVDCFEGSKEALINEWHETNIEMLELCAEDACGLVSIESDFSLSNFITDCGEMGSITVNYTVEDTCQNIEDVEITFVIEDTEAPTVLSDFEEEYTIYCEDLSELEEMEFTDNCGSEELTVNYSELENELSNNSLEIIKNWEVIDLCGNTSSFTQTITVIGEEENLDDVRICLNQESQSLNLNHLLPNEKEDGEWISMNSESIISNGIISFENIEINDYQFLYKYSEGVCRNTYVITVEFYEDCEQEDCENLEVDITKAVTPNGDGVNEYFQVLGLESCDEVVVELEIYNRWGNNVFSSKDYKNNWNGISNGKWTIGNKRQLSSGTYYYVVRLKNHMEKEYQGYIYLGVK
ncbi:gliding motility-associated C-terminal domain-containing protein [Aureivirga sp. CE67]|uniref:gliding motility-associated C-terminal domain-containing protein n=1 Tax=Aureivirga sp. CE67 TaxID=1788983 RepID=UPI0018C9C724|nr:gliding motility-associated C-terminal domain-containing protein [Aureivirga sp. CE67]